jgi:hypothetical protein
MINWKDPRYLQAGTPRQQRGYALLQQSTLWHVLQEFDPVLVGTIPLDIDTPASDLDIICEVPEAAQLRFAQLLRAQFGQQPGFRLGQRSSGSHLATVCSFRYAEELIEVFGQALPTTQQFAFRHLVVEHAVLVAGGEPWRLAVRALKHQGLKTEPAFAQLLHLAGDPYLALLTLEDQSVEALQLRLPPLPAQRY